MRGVGGKLAEGRIDRDPVTQIDLGPRVVVELPMDIREAGVDTSRDAGGASERDEQLGVLVAVASAGAHDLERARDPERDSFRQRVVHPSIDSLGDDAWVALPAREPL